MSALLCHAAAPDQLLSLLFDPCHLSAADQRQLSFCSVFLFRFTVKYPTPLWPPCKMQPQCLASPPAQVEVPCTPHLACPFRSPPN